MLVHSINSCINIDCVFNFSLVSISCFPQTKINMRSICQYNQKYVYTIRNTALIKPGLCVLNPWDLVESLPSLWAGAGLFGSCAFYLVLSWLFLLYSFLKPIMTLFFIDALYKQVVVRSKFKRLGTVWGYSQNGKG